MPAVKFLIEMSLDTKRYVAGISFKHGAVSAGLGVMSKTCTVATPQWGPRVRFGAAVTDAPPQPTNLFQKHWVIF